MKKNEPYQQEYRIITKEGKEIWLLEQGQLIHNKDQLFIESSVSDITTLKEKEFALTLQKQKYQMVLKNNLISLLEYHIHEDYMIIDLQEEEIEKQKRYPHYLDYIKSNKTTVFEEDKEKIYQLFVNRDLKPFTFKEHIRGSDEFLVKSIEASLLYDTDNKPYIILATCKDITSEWKKQNDLKHKAERDGLTQVYNIETGIMKIEKQLTKQKKRYGLIVLDVDYFKSINDTYGHPFGNTVLVALSKLLKEFVNGRGYVIRLGGDEFMLFIYDLLDQSMDSISYDLLERIRALSISSYHITASIGCVSQIGIDPFKSLFQQADKALYTSKQKGRNCVTTINK